MASLVEQLASERASLEAELADVLKQITPANTAYNKAANRAVQLGKELLAKEDSGKTPTQAQQEKLREAEHAQDAAYRKATGLVDRKLGLQGRMVQLDSPRHRAEIQRKQEQRERLDSLGNGDETMAKKVDNKNVPKVYLNDKGKFQVGKDARYKSDLVKSALGIEDDSMLMKFTVKDAEKRLAERSWTGFLDRKRQILADKDATATAKAEAKATAKVEGAAESSPETKAKLAAASNVTDIAEAREVKPDPKPAPRARGGRRGRSK